MNYIVMDGHDDGMIESDIDGGDDFSRSYDRHYRHRTEPIPTELSVAIHILLNLLILRFKNEIDEEHWWDKLHGCTLGQLQSLSDEALIAPSLMPLQSTLSLFLAKNDVDASVQDHNQRFPSRYEYQNNHSPRPLETQKTNPEGFFQALEDLHKNLTDEDRQWLKSFPEQLKENRATGNSSEPPKIRKTNREGFLQLLEDIRNQSDEEKQWWGDFQEQLKENRAWARGLIQ
ncbi:MAG: hypothetical protein AAF639_27280 [Chloroflexota bacterium]